MAYCCAIRGKSRQRRGGGGGDLKCKRPMLLQGLAHPYLLYLTRLSWTTVPAWLHLRAAMSQVETMCSRNKLAEGRVSHEQLHAWQCQSNAL